MSIFSGVLHAVVAVEVGAPGVHVAHAIPLLDGSGTHCGIARCGFPTEYLSALLLDLPWTEVAPQHRCPHCFPDEVAAATRPLR